MTSLEKNPSHSEIYLVPASHRMPPIPGMKK